MPAKATSPSLQPPSTLPPTKSRPNASIYRELSESLQILAAINFRASRIDASLFAIGIIPRGLAILSGIQMRSVPQD